MLITKKKGIFKIIGLMSGTSHDGVDVALAEIKPLDHEDLDLRLISHLHLPYKKKLRLRISDAFNGNTEHICRLNFELGEIFAQAVLKLLESSGYKKGDIDAIASHGQTIYHIPPMKGKIGSTLQIGESSVIAEKTGILTISDFRTKDMAAGGQGAPLVPVADYFIFKKRNLVRAVVNIGGISNVTIVKDRLDDTMGFDIGPGNCLIDEAVKFYSKGKIPFDKNGAIASKGRVVEPLLKELLSLPYFKKKPPKSTGREEFGSELVTQIFRKHRLPIQDILSTLSYLTATSIKDAVKPFEPEEVVLTGGGVKNLFLLSLINKLFSDTNIIVRKISDYGIPVEAKEALSFAIIGYLTLNMRTGNIPSATGARRGVILGKITLP